MRTMHPVLKRGGLYWDRELLPPIAYEARFARIQAAIAEAGDDAWLFYGDVERYGAVAWFSNFLPRTRAALALVPRAGPPTLLLAVGLRDVPAAKTLTWVDDVRPYSSLPRALIALIEERGLQNAAIGLAGVEELIPVQDWNAVAAGLPGMRALPRTRELNRLRARKDECELNAIRAAAGIVSNALDHVAAAIKPGRKAREITAELDRHMRASAAEDARILIAAGAQAGVALRPADDRVLRQGDTVLIYAAAEAQRYWAEAARTFVVGKASGAQREFYARGEQAMEAMRAALALGAGCGGIAAAANAALGAGALAASARAYGFGNGVGLDCEENPMIEIGGEGVAGGDSALALRVMGHADGQGLAFAETVLAGEGRVEFLTGARGLIECA